jgi:hypothetical protein
MMTYYKIENDDGVLQVKRLSLTVPLFKVIHSEGSMEIYRNISSGDWSTLFRSNPADQVSAFTIGPLIEQFYTQIISPAL